MRSIIHRVAAAVFMLVSITHLVSLIVNRKLRHHWMEMLPNVNDPREALANFAYNLGLGDRRPARSPHSYIEKAEYWAVVWGAVVMIATGLLLWANNLAMQVSAQALARRRHFRSLLRSAAGHARHCRLAFLLHHFRSRRLPAEYRLPDRI